jgi:hypothetical protein
LDSKTLSSIDQFPGIDFPPALNSLDAGVVGPHSWGGIQSTIQKGQERVENLDALSRVIQSEKEKIEQRIVANQLYLDVLQQREEAMRNEQANLNRIEELRGSTVSMSAATEIRHIPRNIPNHPA